VQDTDPYPASRSNELSENRIEQLTDWLRLQEASGVGPFTAKLLLDVFGSPRAIFDAGHTALAAHVKRPLAQALCAPPSPAIPSLLDAALAWAAQPGQQVLALGDPGYPQILADIPDPPLLLYIKGRAELLGARALAIVGSRNATVQGKANASSFARCLSQDGIVIVSGLALGIDAAAHEGALDGAGSTVAVVGTGPDIVYPTRNRGLWERIARSGCIVSEYPPGTIPSASNFPKRNRIISGLSAGVLVVEAAARSGSLITAHVAIEQNRDVFAMPGSIHAPLAKGCHTLIREGARLVDSIDDLREVLKLAPRSPLTVAALPTETTCLGLLAHLGHEPIDIDTLLLRSGSTVGALSLELLALEMAGLLERLPGGKVQRVAC